MDAAGNLYISSNNQRVRVVNRQAVPITVLGVGPVAAGNIQTVAGTGTAGFNSDGISAITANLNGPSGLAFDSAGNLLIADSANARIRRVDHTSGIITTVAGTGVAGFSGDGGLATSAQLSSNTADVAVDSLGDIFIGDAANLRVREVVAATGNIQTVAGSGIRSFAGDGGPAVNAELNTSQRIALDLSGNLFIADSFNSRVRFVGTLNPVPGSISSLSPPSATAGGTGFTLTVNGSNFVADSVVNFNGSPRATTFVNSGKLTAQILAGDIAVIASASVTVTNPVPGGGTSAGFPFTIHGVTTINFVGTAGGGKWETPGNWDLNRVPNSTDTVGIDAGQTATISATTGAVAVTALSYASGGSLVISGGSLALTSTSTANILAVSGGTISGAGTIGVNGLLTWSGGTIGGTLTINANAGVTLGGGATSPVLTGATFNNTSGSTATLTGTAAFNINSGATFNNQSGATFLGNDDAGISTTAGAGTFANSGTFTRGVTAGTFAFTTTAFNNSGTVNVNGGTLSLGSGTSSGGGFNVASGAILSLNAYVSNSPSSITGAGNVLFTSGSSTIGGPYTITGTTSVGANNTDAGARVAFNNNASTANLSLVDGALGGTGALTVNGTAGTMTWTGGQLTLGNAGSLTIASGVTLNLNGGNPNSPPKMNGQNSSSFLNIQGTANVNASLDAGNTANIQVLGGGNFNLNGDFFLGAVTVGGSLTFSMSPNSTLTKTAGTSPGGGGFNNNTEVGDTGGNINANVGALHFDPITGILDSGLGQAGGGTTTVKPGASIVGFINLGAGSTLVNNGTITGGVLLNSGTLNGTGTITGNVENAGILHPGSSPGTLTINGNYTQDPSGNLNLDINGTIAGTGYSVLAISGTATLAGTINASTSNNFTPAVGNVFQVMTFASESGSFTTSDLVVNGVNLAPSFNPSGAATNLTLTALAGAPAHIAATAGTSQSTAINSAFATALQATVTDAGSNPVSGAAVTFLAPGSGASGTFSNGTATITLLTNGSGVATATFTANSIVGGWHRDGQGRGGRSGELQFDQPCRRSIEHRGDCGDTTEHDDQHGVCDSPASHSDRFRRRLAEWSGGDVPGAG